MDTTELEDDVLHAKDGVAAMREMVKGRKSFIVILNGMAKILEIAPDACWNTNKDVAFYLRRLAEEMENHCDTLEELIEIEEFSADATEEIKGMIADMEDTMAKVDAFMAEADETTAAVKNLRADLAELSAAADAGQK